MIYFFLAVAIIVCVVLAYHCGKRDGERKTIRRMMTDVKLIIDVHPTPVRLAIDPGLIADVLAAEGWTVSRAAAREPPKPKPH
jgi:2-methylisocitrate lyase-like PEP mutase family enzyme